MKALILSGGTGTRLRPITHTSAKQLVPVANKPILFYGIEAIKAAGINDIGIIVGQTKDEIKAAVGDGSKWNVNITYIEQEAPLGLAHAVKIAEDFIGDDCFVMFLGDNLIKDGITSLVKDFEKNRPNAQILLARVPHPEQFGVAELDDDKIIRLVEKPKKPKSDLALVGVYMFDKNIFTAVNNIKPSGRNELEITDAIQYLIDHDFNVHPHIISGWWKDTGKLEDILEANRIILGTLNERIDGEVDAKSKIEGNVVIEKGAQILNSVIRGPVIIGKDSKIVDSYIGPFTSVYFGVSIEGSELEHSIILEGSKIIGIKRIEDSLVGQNAQILKSTKKPLAYRIMVG
ncbi:MAG: glucose-1-phosphate thymidylyltransferase, partial [bacterium]